MSSWLAYDYFVVGGGHLVDVIVRAFHADVTDLLDLLESFPRLRVRRVNTSNKSEKRLFRTQVTVQCTRCTVQCVHQKDSWRTYCSLLLQLQSANVIVLQPVYR